jgi:ppGpp synthetase/RelA/SpoT-type nucleotidyltranferase
MNDLVAARVIVFDTNDLFDVAEAIRRSVVPPVFNSPHTPHAVAKVRHGQFSTYDLKQFLGTGCYATSQEESGYSSIHFVCRTSQPFFDLIDDDNGLDSVKRLHNEGRVAVDQWHIEIQVRTLMDDAWGETDPFVRYEDAELVKDSDIRDHFTALASYLQAANHHVSLIRQAARRKKHAKERQGGDTATSAEA